MQIQIESYGVGDGISVGDGIGSDGFLGDSVGSGVGSDGLVGDGTGLGDSVGLTVGVGDIFGDFLGDGLLVGVGVGNKSNRTSLCGECATTMMPVIKNKTAPIIKIVFLNIKTSLINFIIETLF